MRKQRKKLQDLINKKSYEETEENQSFVTL